MPTSHLLRGIPLPFWTVFAALIPRIYFSVRLTLIALLLAERMRKVSEDDWLSYLAKSKQKKEEPEELVRPDIQLVVGETDGAKGAKRKRRGKSGRSSKSLKKNDGSSGQIVDLEAGGSQPSSPPPKRSRVLRSRSTTSIKAPGGNMMMQGGVSDVQKDDAAKDVTNVVVENDIIEA
ncbi:hypothetical protein A2U01_0043994, partial [Trifolium medium]|nr:hypothetical protein [Trifolium medium]